MANLNEFRKAPDGVLDFAIDWSNWLDADTISVSTWTAPTGIVKDSSTNTTTTTTVWLSGGTLGATYKVVNHITTTVGRHDDRYIVIRII